jgi:putative restriction endonuclease
VVLSPHDVVVPDLFFVSKERVGIVQEKNVQGAPDLIIEILSKRNRQRDEGIKLEIYDRSGVREYWVFDPAPSSPSRARSLTFEPEHQPFAQCVGGTLQLLERGIGVGFFQTLHRRPRGAEGPRQVRQALAFLQPGHAH